MNVSLSGKAAIVTGAFSGIGLAVVEQFLDAGASVVAVDRAGDPPWRLRCDSTKNLRSLPAMSASNPPPSNSRASPSTASARSTSWSTTPAISIVKAIHEHTPDEWDAVMNTNVKALYWAARHVIPQMIKSGGGVILNTGSISGVAGIPTQGAYGAIKGSDSSDDPANGYGVCEVQHPRKRHRLRNSRYADRAPLGRSFRRSAGLLENARRKIIPSAESRPPRKWRVFSSTWPATWRVSLPAR